MENPYIGFVFNNVDFSGENLTDDYTDCDFNMCDFSGVAFESLFTVCKFYRCIFQDIDADWNHFVNCRFNDCEFL